MYFVVAFILPFLWTVVRGGLPLSLSPLSLSVFSSPALSPPIPRTRALWFGSASRCPAPSRRIR
jgi:hypothetical protein